MKGVSQNGQQVNEEDIDDAVCAIMFGIFDLSPVYIFSTNRFKKFEENTKKNMSGKEWKEALRHRYAINPTFLLVPLLIGTRRGRAKMLLLMQNLSTQC